MFVPIARSAVFLVGFEVQPSGSILGTGCRLVHFVLLLHLMGGFFLTKLLFGFHALVDIHQRRENKAVGENEGSAGFIISKKEKIKKSKDHGCCVLLLC